MGTFNQYHIQNFSRHKLSVLVQRQDVRDRSKRNYLRRVRLITKRELRVFIMAQLVESIFSYLDRPVITCFDMDEIRGVLELRAIPVQLSQPTVDAIERNSVSTSITGIVSIRLMNAHRLIAGYPSLIVLKLHLKRP